MRAIERAARALEYAWETNPDCPGEMYAREADKLARAAVLAFLEGASEYDCVKRICDRIGVNSQDYLSVLAALRAEAGETE